MSILKVKQLQKLFSKSWYNAHYFHFLLTGWRLWRQTLAKLADEEYSVCDDCDAPALKKLSSLTKLIAEIYERMPLF